MQQSYLQNPGFQSTHMNPQTAQTFQTSGQQQPYSAYSQQAFGQQQPMHVYGQQPLLQSGVHGFGQGYSQGFNTAAGHGIGQVYGQGSGLTTGQSFGQVPGQAFGQTQMSPSYSAHQSVQPYGQQAFSQTFSNPLTGFSNYANQSLQGMVTAPHQPYHLSNYQGNVMGHDRYLNQDAIIPSQRQYPQSGFAAGTSFVSH